MYEDENLDEKLNEPEEEGLDDESENLEDEGLEDEEGTEEYEEGGSSGPSLSDRIRNARSRNTENEDEDLKEDIDNAKDKKEEQPKEQDENQDNKKNNEENKKDDLDKKDNNDQNKKGKNETPEGTDKKNDSLLGDEQNRPKQQNQRNKLNSNDASSEDIKNKLNDAKNKAKQNNPASTPQNIKTPKTTSNAGGIGKEGLKEGAKKGAHAAAEGAKKGAQAAAKGIAQVLSKLPPQAWAVIGVIILVILFITLLIVFVGAIDGDSGDLGYSTGGVSMNLTQKCEKGVQSTGGKAVGTTYELNEYLARVIKKELGNGNDEALKAQTVLARTRVLESNKNKSADEVCTIEFSTNAQDVDVDASKTELERYLKIVEETNGQVLTENKSIISSYYATWPNGTDGSQNWNGKACKPITCSNGNCTTTFYKYPSGTAWDFTMPEKNSDGKYWNGSGLTAGSQVGHCHGVSQLGLLWLTSEEGYDHMSALKYFMDTEVEIGNYLSQAIVPQNHEGVVQLLQQELTAWNNGNDTTHQNMIKKYTGSGIFAWCASFTHWILIEAGVYDSIGFNGPKGWTFVSYYSSGTNSQCLSPATYNPQPGDLFIFDNDSSDGVDDYDHIGFVLEDLGDTYTTIEGNWSNALKSVTKSDSSTTCFVSW